MVASATGAVELNMIESFFRWRLVGRVIFLLFVFFIGWSAATKRGILEAVPTYVTLINIVTFDETC